MILRVITATGEVIYGGFNEEAAKKAAEKAPVTTSIWRLVGVEIDWKHLTDAQKKVLQTIESKTNGSTTSAVRHAKTCVPCQMDLFQAG